MDHGEKCIGTTVSEELGVGYERGQSDEIVPELFPATLPVSEVCRVNWRGLSPDIHSARTYEWRGMQFEAPPGVFVPGPTARLIHDRIMDGVIPVAGKRYAAMGVGLGVETVAAGLQGAAAVYGVDVHYPSVKVAERYYRSYVASDKAPFVGVVSDLWSNFPHVEPLDVITFNPPLIDVVLSEDPEIVRNLCQGIALAERFFTQLSEFSILASGGTIYVVLSNTAPLREFVALAIRRDYRLQVIHEQGWPGEEVRTYVFDIRPAGSLGLPADS
jgi:release factor glutamine methyltransferase